MKTSNITVILYNQSGWKGKSNNMYCIKQHWRKIYREVLTRSPFLVRGLDAGFNGA